jgi:hypothetical protein
MKSSRWGKGTSSAPLLLTLALLALAGMAYAGIVIEERPASLLSRNIVMRNGKPFVALADLARALGGSGNYNAGERRYRIVPAAGGVLQLNPGALSSFNRDLKNRIGSQNTVMINFGGQDVMIDDAEYVLLRPSDPGVSLALVARLLGGSVRFDKTSGAWKLPSGGPDSPLRFQK